jgi:hypothetical protein
MSTTATRTRRSRKSSADALAANESNGVGKGAKPAAKNTEPKEPRFPAAISAAVKCARTEMHAKKPGLGDKRAPAASAGDHIAVRAVIADLIDGTPTADKVLATTGLSFPKLRAVAEFQTGTDDDLKTLRESRLGGESAKFDTNRAWRTGRFLAGIAAAYVIELRAAAKKS